MLTANWRRAGANLATLPASHHKARACNRTEDSVALCYLEAVAKLIRRCLELAPANQAARERE
ncbi:hypothetical protein, partial [Burkholderia cepacia]